MWKQILVIVILAFFFNVALFLIGYHEGYNDAKHKFCTHGESSITATKINGQWVQSKPVRTGC